MSHNNNNDGNIEGDISECPVDEETRLKWLEQNMKVNKSLNEDKLSMEREISGIPRTGQNGQKWIYPSEQQFYDAMARKDLNADKMDMKTVIPIHNNINERVWNYIKQWENVSSNNSQDSDDVNALSLTSFKGDSHKITPRAWIRHYIFGMDLPFDRHDWQINHKNSSNSSNVKIDYVIDFYMNKQEGVYLDVRPKLNSFEGCKRRILHLLGL
ncbi:similar to Saccharomyces cerevisiae YKL087C CYT2 Cytochrome c1 heme lyase, involved in maturation of cytochrome c1, which is a subunit of the mitochondrial ubiquinol-cytochrome-c reductase [Maudiozyma barnettii]|uniref:Holocytochrome c-type synthase n=1 Tax=Maudiozyma barnettii TaxID=61262 RepID=A0A8H2ZIN3_9SACH|nr:cytochrome c1 heme lyase CYT2 [Kazachstania barnettii]CAB4256088.1 similar to Saccharomyces cerevisiae YKL087C CYT2 Cytochrome c1 heme lyase, involved in maturation of cytochrome c1, which is a subunit of the mitochondrial ubiquinol-cytochrome-c reductase [Kazachstania barnettii]CAD1784696.1 similar to Saccharomyces cerevisiae YKL087C CYT2 Cytochrome c1 heme lyase, involved in maturation of cytochrome c1, which is a subunit of the mitochondrial ubiquinol-cytochrome-c reductase [Kazachstania ba